MFDHLRNRTDEYATSANFDQLRNRTDEYATSAKLYDTEADSKELRRSSGSKL